MGPVELLKGHDWETFGVIIGVEIDLNFALKKRWVLENTTRRLVTGVANDSQAIDHNFALIHKERMVRGLLSST